MSIIADTLKRLQARSTGTEPEVFEESSLRPPFNQGEGPGRHLKHSRFKFWMIGVGITLGLAGLALSAFWVGWQFDFGFSTDTHALGPQRHRLYMDPEPSNDLLSGPNPSDTVAAAEPAPQSIPPTPVAQPTQTHASPPPIEANRPSIPEPSSAEVPLAAQPELSPSKPPTLNQSQNQQIPILASTQSADIDSRQIARSKSAPEESSDLGPLMETPPSDVEPTLLVGMVSRAPQEPEGTNPAAVLLEEEMILTEELVKTPEAALAPTAASNQFDTPSTLQEALEAAEIPRQTLPATRIRHAQQLIQAGNYEEAAGWLSPLFHDPPVTWQPWFWMGTALLGKGDTEQADHYFLSGLARNDKVPQLWIQRALVAQQRGDYQLAIHDLRQAEALDANLPHIHLNMGYAYEQLGNNRLANQYYGNFLKLSEGQPGFFSTRKKLFARVTGQTSTGTPSPLSLPEP